MRFFVTRARTAIALLSSCGAVAAVATSAVAQTDGSALRPGDVLRVAVWQRPELSGDFTIAADSTLANPIYRSLRAGGVPLPLIEERVRDFLKTYQADPQVTVQPLVRIAVTGEVRTPNLYLMAPTTTVAQAIAMAGGPTDRARLDHVRVLRGNAKLVLDLEPTASLPNGELVRSGDQIWVDRSNSFVREWLVPAGGIISAAALLARVLVYRR